MGHVIHSINTTVSGLCHHLDSVIDDSHHQYAIDLTLSADALVFGRNTFDLFTEFWPSAVNRPDLPEPTRALANAFHGTPKLVVSSRPVDSSWNNTRCVQGPGLDVVASEINALPGNAVIFGSPGLAASLLNEGLINELHIVAQPYIGVEGPRLYSALHKRAQLALLDASALKCGSALIRYDVLY